MQDQYPARPDVPGPSSRAPVVALVAALAWFPLFLTGDRWKYLLPFADAAWTIGVLGLPILAVAVGRKARRRANGDVRDGRAIATIGTVLGWIELGILASTLLFGVVVAIRYMVGI